MNYIAITPVKNEEAFIDRVAESMINQTLRPVMWFIIDGGSTDSTEQKLQAIAKDKIWIQILHQSNLQENDFRRQTTSHHNVAVGVSEAYSYAKQWCITNNIDYKYILTIDGDQAIGSNFCESLIDTMENNPNIGAASSSIFNPGGSRDVYPAGEISNKRMYLKAAVESVGGFPVTKYSYDTVILAKLRISGWEIRELGTYLVNYRIDNLREDSGIERGVWKSSITFGKARYYLGYSFPLLIAGCGYMILHGHFCKSVGVFAGYIGSWFAGDEKIRDIHIREHFGKNRLKELL
jgi:glycosyltransferase involved in cell wall biosynthesis